MGQSIVWGSQRKTSEEVAVTHSSEEPQPSLAQSPGAGHGSKRERQEASGSETHQRPCVGPGQSHRGSQVHASLITPAETMSGNDAQDPSASNDNSYIIQHLSLGCAVISSLVGDSQWLSDGGRTIAGPHFVFEKCSCFHDTASKEGRKKPQCGFVLFSAKNLPVCKNKADTEPDTRQGKIISSHFLSLLFPSPRCVFYPLNHHMSEEMGGN